VQSALEDLLVPAHAKVYVSTIGKSSVVISGPPSTMAKLFSQSSMLEHSDNTPLPVMAAFHAEHLNPISLHRLTGGSHQTLLERKVEHRSIISSHSGAVISGETFGDLLQKVYDDILQLPVFPEAITQGIRKYQINKASCVHLGPESVANIISPLPETIPKSLPTKPAPAASHVDPRDIAIIGMGIRLPGSETLDEFWTTLVEGRDLHEQIPADRFDISTHFDPSGNRRNTTHTPYGAFVERAGYFDRHMFKMSPREARQTDPQQRLLLLATYEALEMAGYSFDGSAGAYPGRRVGSFIGQTSDDWREVNASQDVDTYFIPGGMRAFGPGKLHYHFGWEGPSYSVDTACSSSASAIQLAVSSLLSRDCDMAIGGGVNFLSAPDIFAGLSRGGFLSATGGCNTFDDAADGYCRADGVGVVVLKRLSDALNDRDVVLAVLRGAMTNHSAGAVSITHPHRESQEKLFKTLLTNVNLEPRDIDYVEMHGTGTQAGDATEMSSVINALAKGCRTKANPLYVGSVKPNLGHGESASGVTSLIKAVMMLRKNTIPPHVGIKGHINKNLPDLEEFHTRLSAGNTPFLPRRGHNATRAILVNNFDAAGGNTSIVIQDPPLFVIEGADPRLYHVVTISGKTSKSVLGNCKRLLNHLEQHPNIRLEDVAYTTTARRIQNQAYRRAYTESSVSGLRQSLKQTIARKERTKAIPRNTSASLPFVIFTFTGQGCAYASMGSELLDTYRPFRDSIVRMAEICISYGFPSFLPLIEDPQLSLSEATPVQVQTAILAIELAIVELWKHIGVAPDAVIGHSLGEMAALCTAGVLSVATCLYLCGRRAQLLEKRCTPGTHAMLAVRASAVEVEGYLLDMSWQKDANESEEKCELACINSATSTVVSGPARRIKKLQQHLQSLGVKTCLLDVPYAFHSSQMDVVLDDYEAEGRSASFAPPRIPIASTERGKLIAEGSIIDEAYLRRQTREGVRFSSAVDALRSEDRLVSGRRCVWIEVGPHSPNLDAIRSILTQSGEKNDLFLPSMRKGEDNWKVWSGSVAAAYEAGLNIDWRQFHRPFEKALRLVELPSYAFDLDNYWIQYKGDWSLTKGRPRAIHNACTNGINRISKQHPSLPSIYRVQTKSINASEISMTFAIDISDTRLEDVLRGHVVNGNQLCSSALYADIAFTIAGYMRGVANADGTKPSLCMDVQDMEVFEPLIVREHDPTHVLLVTASLVKEVDVVRIKFTSQQGISNKKDHAQCMVSFGNGEAWRKEWQQRTSTVQDRIKHLILSSRDGPTHRILRSMAYKLFSSFVDYSAPYQGMQKVYLDSSAREAAAEVRFNTNNGAGMFMYHPCWIDSIAHLSGFVMNGSDTTPADTVYISHGWKSMRVARTSLTEAATYQTYVHMKDDARAVGVVHGDVYVLEADSTVVALIKGMKFRRIKRFQLAHFLPQQSDINHTGTERNKEAQPHIGGIKRDPRVAKSITVDVGDSDNIANIAHAKMNGSEPRTMHMDAVLSIIAEEVGVGIGDLPDHAFLADSGVDSLLSLSIAAKVKEIVGWEVPSTVFYSSASVADLRVNLDKYNCNGVLESRADDTTAPPLGSASNETTIKPEHSNGISNGNGMQAQKKNGLKSNGDIDVDLVAGVNLLHCCSNRGATGTERTNLFVFPDGGGRASSYTGLMSVLDDANCSFDAIYGLDSPLLGKPADALDDVSLNDVVGAFIHTIRTVQPHGPYHLGGWSVGGVFAFEAATHFQDVSSLFIIDPPCPKTLTESNGLAQAMYGFEAAIHIPDIALLVHGNGTRINSKTTFDLRNGDKERMQEHFAISLKILEKYRPNPLRIPGLQTTLLWAKHGVLETMDKETIINLGHSNLDAASNWILQRRGSYGPNGWDMLLRDTEIKCNEIDGDHFSMMKVPAVYEVGRILGASLRPRVARGNFRVGNC